MDAPMKAQRARKPVAPAAAPDGGYGWFIVLACFLVFGLTFGVIKAFGVFYVEIHQYFDTTATAASWITSIAVATIHVAAPIAAALSARYSHRAVVMTGGLLCSLGMLTGAYVSNLMELYITVGFWNGFGYALTWTPTVTMLGSYFDKKRPLANALASTGECVLTFLLTPLFQLLIDTFSWRGAMLLLGGLQLNLCVCGMLLRPLKITREVNHFTEGKDKEGGLVLELCPMMDGDLEQNKPNALEDRTTDTGPEEIPNINAKAQAKAKAKDWRIRLQMKVLPYVDYTLITNARFFVYSMFGVFAALGFFAPSLFLVPYARSQGIEEYQAAALISISAALDLTGRLFSGWIANLRLMETVQQLIITVILQGTVLLFCPLASSFSELAVFSTVYGLAYGATVSIHITVLAEVVGVERLGSALGFFMLIRSSGGLLGPPIAGLLIDRMSDYGTGFLMAGVALIVSALFLLLLHHMNRRSQSSSPKAGDLPVDAEQGQMLASVPDVLEKK
ncbi:monocarboxylate transporter 2 [Lampris incognitus]|uniref:monocarboxylate transporter 2 n=1 Tax=Lampris incognitus TaxID=2546036 RepID=UPI0024B4B275|nr:monocarboxylate transporter 2 [Lampris incognitus]